MPEMGFRGVTKSKIWSDFGGNCGGGALCLMKFIHHSNGLRWAFGTQDPVQVKNQSNFPFDPKLSPGQS